MSEQVGSHAPGIAQVAAEESERSADHGGSGAGDGPRPGDPVDRELAQVEDAMAAVRARVRTAGDVRDHAAAVPSDDEVAVLEVAHDALRATLDRVDRRG